MFVPDGERFGRIADDALQMTLVMVREVSKRYPKPEEHAQFLIETAAIFSAMCDHMAERAIVVNDDLEPIDKSMAPLVQAEIDRRREHARRQLDIGDLNESLRKTEEDRGRQMRDDEIVDEIQSHRVELRAIHSSRDLMRKRLKKLEDDVEMLKRRYPSGCEIDALEEKIDKLFTDQTAIQKLQRIKDLVVTHKSWEEVITSIREILK